MADGNFLRGGRTGQMLLSRTSLLRSNVLLSYCAGLCAFIPALTLRVVLDEALYNYPFITFIPAVVIATFFGGLRAGVLSGVLSFLTAWYWFVEPRETFSTSYHAIITLVLFAFVIILDIIIIEVASRAVDRLAAREAQLDTIVETVPLGLFLAELPSGRIVGGNKYAKQMLDHPVRNSAEIHGSGGWEAYHEDGSRVLENEFPLARILFDGEENPSIDVQHLRGDGSKAWTRIMGRPVKDIGGTITGGVVAVIDIHEQHQTQVALQEALTAKEVLLYEVNHRVKNSLQLVSSFLLLEASKIENNEGRTAVMAAREKVDLVARLHRLLYASGTHDRIDLKIALEDIVRHLLLSAGREDVHLELLFSGDLLIDLRHASPLVLAVNEFVTNAMKYGLGSIEPKLAVTASRSLDRITLEIRDNGPGFSAEATGNKPCMGGEIIEGLVSQMRGSLAFESDNSGTAITLIIPAGPEHSVQKG
jgi:PAS domain S-box-containing protein